MAVLLIHILLNFLGVVRVTSSTAIPLKEYSSPFKLYPTVSSP
eukprot:gene28813-35741_t